jgi:hypothetical protein
VIIHPALSAPDDLPLLDIMYTCQKCGQTVPRRVPAHRLAIETRERSYPFRPKANRKIYVDKKWITPDDPGGTGYETVREIVVCPACAGDAQQNGHD